MQEYKELLDNMTWSFSRVTSFSHCPKMFKLTYIDHVEKLPNAFSDYGTYLHELLESYYLGKTDLWDLASNYTYGYDDFIKSDFPPNRYVDLKQSYFEAGKKYLEAFEDPWNDCEILGVEQQVLTTIGGYKFVGYIDLVLRDPQGRIIIVDHKSRAKFKNDAERREYLHQLYLYSIYVKETYGEYPYKLVFNVFRFGIIDETVFEETELEVTKKWFVDEIQRIYGDEKFNDVIALKYKQQGKKLKEFKKDDFFCNYICSVRRSCNRSSDKPNRREGRYK